MNFKRYLALLLCLVAIAAVLTGCNTPVKSPFVSGSPSPSGVSASPTPGAPALNTDAAYKALDAKTVMLTVNGKDITWDTLFYYIYYCITDIQQNGEKITNWSATYQDETSYKDYVLSTAVNLLLQDSAIEYGAEQTKVTLSPKDQTDIQADWDAQVKNAGSEEAWLKKLQTGYCSKEIFTRMENIAYLQQACFKTMYGDRGSKLSDKDVADYNAKNEYMMAKHILFLTTKTDESGSQSNMTDAEKAQVKQKAESVLNQLKSYKGSDFNSFFNELMNANTQDPGIASYPDGYLFQSGEMVTQFDDAAKALQVGQFTQSLVETDYGYHIIYRTPVNYEETPMQFSNYGQYSLRFVTAINMFTANKDTWLNSLKVTYGDKYKALDFNKMFAMG